MSVVFFDLDGTIVRGQSQMLLLVYLAREGIIGKLLFVKVCLLFLAYKAGLLQSPERAMAYAYRHIVMGLSKGRMEYILADFIDNVLRRRFCAPVVARVKRHIEDGDEVVLVTNVFESLAKMVANKLAIGKVIATRMEMTGRVYTGNIEGKIMYGDNKAEVLRGHYNEEQLKGGCAYADHPSDRAVLDMVGTAFLVNAKKGKIEPYGSTRIGNKGSK